jgi:hypothetical protein
MPGSYNVVAVRRKYLVIGILFGCAAITPSISAQDTVETTGATSTSTHTALTAKTIAIPQATPKPSASAASLYIVGSRSAGSVEANRHALEAKAGTDGANLLLRSTPSEAQVWLDGRPVGNTPLLLIVPAGKYTVEMRGIRMETCRQVVALLPKETREVAMKMQLRYPSRVIAAY